jgi:hypothetical protein
MSYLCKTNEMGNDSDTSLKKKIKKVFDKSKKCLNFVKQKSETSDNVL